jgi:hypothetical protein
MGVRGELYSSRVILPNRTYFFNVKENRMGDLYLNIVESKNRDNGGFDRQSVVLFADDLQEFLKGFDESLKVLEKSVRSKRQSFGEKPKYDNSERGAWGASENRERGEISGREPSERRYENAGREKYRQGFTGGGSGSGRQRQGFGGDRDGRSKPWQGFGGDRDGRSKQRKSFGGERDGYSKQRKNFGAERDGFSKYRKDSGGEKGRRVPEGSKDGRVPEKRRRVVVKKHEE